MLSGPIFVLILLCESKHDLITRYLSQIRDSEILCKIRPKKRKVHIIKNVCFCNQIRFHYKRGDFGNIFYPVASDPNQLVLIRRPKVRVGKESGVKVGEKARFVTCGMIYQLHVACGIRTRHSCHHVDLVQSMHSEIVLI